MSYPPPFSLLCFISVGSCLVIFQSVVLDSLSVHFRCKILRKHLLVKVRIILASYVYFAMSPIYSIDIPFCWLSLGAGMISARLSRDTQSQPPDSCSLGLRAEEARDSRLK